MCHCLYRQVNTLYLRTRGRRTASARAGDYRPVGREQIRKHAGTDPLRPDQLFITAPDTD